MNGITIVLIFFLLLIAVLFFLFLNIFLQFAFYQALSRNDEDLFNRIYHGCKASQIFGADIETSIKLYKSWYSIITLDSKKVKNNLLLIFYKLSFVLFLISLILFVSFLFVVKYTSE